jgi:hypothetical protein
MLLSKGRVHVATEDEALLINSHLESKPLLNLVGRIFIDIHGFLGLSANF